MSLRTVPFSDVMTLSNERGWSCPLIVVERLGLKRIKEPVTVGIPFPSGRVMDVAQLVLLDERGAMKPLQVKPLSYWSDGSVQWGLLDFLADAEPQENVDYRVEYGSREQLTTPHNPFTVQQGKECLTIDTGSVRFQVNTKVLKPFESVEVDGIPFIDQGRSSVILVGENGTQYEPKISSVEIETQGPVRLTLRIFGAFSHDAAPFADFISRMSFYANSGLVEMQLTLRNSRAAHHPGGLWDLGDPGSIYFSDLSVQLAMEEQGLIKTVWNTNPLDPFCHREGMNVHIYQHSSGGTNWRSLNHVNRDGKVMQSCHGYYVMIDGSRIEEGKRATPFMGLESDHKWIGGTIGAFWQNFPKGLAVRNQQLSLQLFPSTFQDVHELQGGEQKTHTVYLQFSRREGEPRADGWIHERLMARSTPEWYAQSKAVSYLTPRSQDENQDYVQLIDSIVNGENSFVERREIIDEYGWRNFGEVYADHESVGQQEGQPRVSHYNNQYDCVYGAYIEYLRTGDSRWFSLMQDLARHVIDIDIYHTQEDRPAYNGGLFWHTDHYVNAATATHRTYSKANQPPGVEYGGGPSNEHNYATGLLHYYFLTGDPLAREAVQSLADWVLNMDAGGKGILGWLDQRPKGLASSTVSREYHGPGRGAGNSISVLLDGYRVTWERRYFDKAEELIRRCIHPRDSIKDRNLGDVEHRWSYTVFLQVLGKYLDFKVCQDELDDMYAYAQASLLHYASWMLDHEVPYKQVFDRVEFPTETWPAQDIRKSNVFKYAAKYAENSQRAVFLEKSDLFFTASIRDLLSFETCRLTRPLVLILVNGYMHAYFHHFPNESSPTTLHEKDFGTPRLFTAQLNELYTAKKWVRSWLACVKTWIGQ